MRLLKIKDTVLDLRKIAGYTEFRHYTQLRMGYPMLSIPSETTHHWDFSVFLHSNKITFTFDDEALGLKEYKTIKRRNR